MRPRKPTTLDRVSQAELQGLRSALERGRFETDEGRPGVIFRPVQPQYGFIELDYRLLTAALDEVTAEGSTAAQRVLLKLFQAHAAHG